MLVDPSKDASLQDLFIIPIRKPLVPGMDILGAQQRLAHEQLYHAYVDQLVTPFLCRWNPAVREDH